MLIGAEDLVAVEASGAAVVAEPHRFSRRTVTIDVAGLHCAVHFDRTGAAARFARRYADLTIDGDAELHTFAMRDPLAGWLFWSRGSTAFRWPHGELSDAAVAFLADAVALTDCFRTRTDGVVSLHAATLGLPGGVATILGNSNVGKTTTALACARRGMTLYSDERCVIDANSLIHPFPRALNVRAPGLRLLTRDVVPGHDAIGALLCTRADGAWSDVRISQLTPERMHPAPRPLRAAFVLAGTAPKPELERISPSSAALAAARWAHGVGSGLDKVQRLVSMFSGIACYRLRLGTPDASARRIRAALKAEISHGEMTA